MSRKRPISPSKLQVLALTDNQSHIYWGRHKDNESGHKANRTKFTCKLPLGTEYPTDQGWRNQHTNPRW